MSTQILNQDQLTTKGALLLPSRLDAGDLQRIIKLCGGRSLALLTEGESGITPALQSAIRSSGLSQFPRMDEHSRETVAAAVEKGTLILCIPPAVQSRRATNVLIPRDYLTDIAGYQLPTQCIGVEHPQENALDVEDRSSLPACVFQLSPLLPGADATPAALQQALISAHAEAYASRATFEGNLGRMMVAGLKQHSSATIVDGLDGSVTPYSRIFAAAAALAGFIKKETKEPRVGIVLPPGRAALIANLAVVFAGKVPVNLNYTAGKEAVVYHSGCHC